LPSGTAELEFYTGYSTSWLAGATMNLWISTDSGQNWDPNDNPIWEAINDGQPWGWRKQTLDLSSYAGNLYLMLAWGYVGQGGDLVGLDGVKLVSNGTVSINNQKDKIAKFTLEQNSPNPFNPVTTISYLVPKETHIVITIYDIAGRKVKTILNKKMQEGQYSISWDGKDELGKVVSNGVYLYDLKTDEVHLSKKMIFLK